MVKNQSSEDYLETILVLSQGSEFVHRIDVARKLGVSQPAVQKAVKILIEEGFVRTDGMHVYLTDAGKSYAERVFRRHCVISGFLTELGVEPSVADAEACEIEHVISEDTFKKIQDFVENLHKKDN